MIPDNSNIKDIRSFCVSELSSKLSLTRDVASLEIDLLLLHAFKEDGAFSPLDNRTKILGSLDDVLTTSVYNIFSEYYEKRKSGEPIEYITKKKDFYGHEFFIDSRVLIPRSDTEILVTKFIEIFEQKIPASLSLVDVGIGSAAILCSCLLELRKKGALNKVSQAIGIDICKDALKVAEYNIQRFNLGNQIELCHGSLIGALDLTKLNSELVVIISNPPYLDENDKEICARVKAFEPNIALFSEDEGFQHLESLISDFANTYYKYPQPSKGAHLLLEIGHKQANRLKSLAQNWSFLKIEIANDLCGLNRMFHIFTY